MTRLEWTEADQRIAWRRWAGWRHDLDDPEVLPFHLRDASRDQPLPLAPHFEQARAAKHRAPDPDDEEPSPAADTARTRTLRLLIIAGAVIVGLWAVRSLMGAS